MTTFNTVKRKKRRFSLFEWDENSHIPSGNITYILAFAIPAIIFLALYIARGIYPFGDSCFLRTDMYHQYAPFFAEFNDKISSFGNLSYSWNTGMGTNFTALYAYYLASPMNWFVFLFPTEATIEIMNVLIIFKLCLASCTLVWYLVKRFGAKPCTLAIFGTFYAMSGYVAAYNWNIMWLDLVWLLPIVILGLERLVKEDNCFLYSISLGLCIFSNYYIAIMVCITCVIYFIILMFSYGLSSGITGVCKKLIHFCIYSLLAGGLAACMLLPEIHALSLTASSSISFPEKLTEYFPILEMLVRHLVNVPVHMGLDHHPNIYCGIFTLLLLVLYALNRNIPLREKVGKFIILVVFLLGFNLNIPNFIWHGLHFPNSLPCRQSFIYIFFMLTMAYEAFRDIRHYNRRNVSTAFWVLFGFVLLCDQIIDGDYYNFKIFYVSGALIMVYTLLMLLYRRHKLPVAVSLFLFFAVTIGECTMNMAITGIGTTSRVAYVSDNAAIDTLLEQTDKSDNSFYRVEKLFGRRTKNDGAWHNYKSISSFSSMANKGVGSFLKSLGFQASTNAYVSSGGTLVSYSLLNVRYFLSSKQLAASSLFKYVSDIDGMYLYENPYVLQPGFAIPATLDDKWTTLTTNGITAQNSLIESITGVRDVFKKLSTHISESYANFTPEKSGHIYGVLYGSSTEDLSFTVNSDITYTYDGLNKNYLIDFGYLTTDDSISVSSSSSMNMDLYILDEEAFLSAINIMKETEFKINEFKDTHISGTVDIKEDSDFLFTIPYDDGWTVRVDGEKVETYDFKNALIAIHLTSGSHTITLDYKTVGFSNGMTISIISALILLCIYLFKRLSLWDILMSYKPKLLDETDI